MNFYQIFDLNASQMINFIYRFLVWNLALDSADLSDFCAIRRICINSQNLRGFFAESSIIFAKFAESRRENRRISPKINLNLKGQI